MQTLERLRAEKEAQLEQSRLKDLETIGEAHGIETASSQSNKSVTAAAEDSAALKEQTDATNQLNQQAAAIELAGLVAAVGENEGPRLDAGGDEPPQVSDTVVVPEEGTQSEKPDGSARSDNE